MKTSVGLSDEEIAQSKALFGPAPILSTEDDKSFETLLSQVIAILSPRDLIELLYIRRFVIETWTIERLSRHSTIAMERRYRESLEHLHQRAKLREAGKLPRNPFAGVTPSDIGHLMVLEDNFVSSYSDVDEILKRKATEIDHNRALERSIVFQENLDKLIARSSRRRDDALEQMEVYRCGLGEQARQAVERALEDEGKSAGLKPTEAPALAPSDETECDD